MAGVEEIRPGRKVWAQLAHGEDGKTWSDAGVLAVLVHGACAHHSQWKLQVAALRTAGVTCLSYDMLGCGESAKPRNVAAYNPEEHYLDLQALVAKYAAKHAKIILVAHSFGCLLALHMVADQPGQLAGVVLVSPYYPGNLAPPAVPSIYKLPQAALRLVQPQLTHAFLKRAYTLSFRMSQPQVVAEERAASNANPAHMVKAFYAQLAAWVDSNPTIAWARSCTLPALILCGTEDQARLSCSAMPGAAVAIPRAPAPSCSRIIISP